MDNPEPATRLTTVSFGPDRRVALLALLVAVIFAALVLSTLDAAGRLFYGVAALLALSLGVVDLVVNPRVILDAGGLALRRGIGWRRVPWHEVESVVVDEHTRHGLSSRAIEIDEGATLTVLTRHTLGADPRDVKTVFDAFLQ